MPQYMKPHFYGIIFLGHDFNFKETLIIARGYSKTLFSIGILFHIFPFWMYYNLSLLHLSVLIFALFF